MECQCLRLDLLLLLLELIPLLDLCLLLLLLDHAHHLGQLLHLVFLVLLELLLLFVLELLAAAHEVIEHLADLILDQVAQVALQLRLHDSLDLLRLLRDGLVRAARGLVRLDALLLRLARLLLVSVGLLFLEAADERCGALQGRVRPVRVWGELALHWCHHLLVQHR